VATRTKPDTVEAEWMWKAVSSIAGLVGAMVARKLLRVGYRAVRKDTDPESPFDPTDARFSTADALLWAVASGVGLAVARIVSARVAAIGWKAATGEAPPAPSPI
jgi:hypothetical protein